MNYLIFDIETSISEDGGASPHNPDNRAYVVISKMKHQDVRLQYSPLGMRDHFPIDLHNIDIIVGHNLKFDLSYFWKCEKLQEFFKRGGMIWDTQYAEFLLSGQTHKFPSLKQLSMKYVKKSLKEDRVTKWAFKKGIGADKILAHPRANRFKQLFGTYCKSDGIMTEKVFFGQLKEAKKQGMIKLIRCYNQYLLYQCEEENNGIYYDTELAREEMGELSLQKLDLVTGIIKIAERYWNEELPEFNFNSKDHLSALIYGANLKYKKKVQEGFFKNGNPKMRVKEFTVSINAFKQPLKDATKTKKPGVYVVDENVLERLSESSNEELAEFCTLLLKCRKLEKLIGTYYKPNLKVSRDNIIHQSYNNCVIPTGRLSCSVPNMQNQHPKVKHLYKSRWGTAGIICELDFSQLEVLVQAWLSGCDRMMRHIEEGIDFHTKRLAYAMNLSYDETMEKVLESEEWQLKRKKAKGVSFQKSYGAAPKSISTSTGLPEETVVKIFEQEDREYPEIGRFYKMVNEEIISDSKLTNQLLYIRDKATGREFTDPEEFRHIGCYRSVTTKKYCFYDKAALTSRGLFKYWPQPNIYNFPVQGTAADIQAATSATLFKVLLGHRDKIVPINEVHDSKIFDIKIEWADKLIPKIQEIMSKVGANLSLWLGLADNLNIKVDAEVGYNWGELVPYTGNIMEDLDGKN